MFHDTRARRLRPLFGLVLLLAGCAHHQSDEEAASDEVNAYPKTYKSDILAAMHAYLNDPTGIRDDGIGEPMLKPVNGVKHYVACLRFNAKKNARDYAGPKEMAAVYIAGRFDHFVDAPKSVHELCAGTNYAPFPELAALTR
jgi:hypothetical protein